MYNLSQAVTAPVMAVAVNSGLIHHNRLWHESRIAVFQTSIDTRSTTHQKRGTHPRVHFGDAWIGSIVDVFRDDISRFSVVLTSEFEEDPVEMVRQGIIPKLKALMLHNGTVYRWNRPCYGVKDNIPHLRIENRVLPSGPSVIDEVANSAFYFGLMSGLSNKNYDVREHMRFSSARSNFLQACRTGLESHFKWFDGEPRPASELILNDLLPEAESGLKASGIDDDDIVTTIHVRRERRLVLAAQTKGNNRRQTTQDNVLRVDNDPFFHHIGRFLAECFHVFLPCYNSLPEGEGVTTTQNPENSGFSLQAPAFGARRKEMRK